MPKALLDQVVSFSGNRVSEKDVTEILGIIDRGVILDACRALIDGSAKRCLELIDRIYTYGYDTRTFYHNLMEQLRDLLVCLLTPEDYLVDFIGPDKDEIIDLAKGAGYIETSHAPGFDDSKGRGAEIFIQSPPLS